jgi:predicted aspartyl protease
VQQQANNVNSFQVTAIDLNSEVYLNACIKYRGKVVNTPAVLDSGCNQSILPARLCSKQLQPANCKLYAANNSQVPIKGKTVIHFTVDGIKLSADVLVSEHVDEFLLGFDFLQTNKCMWNFAESTVVISGHVLKLRKRQSCAAIRRLYTADNLLIEGNSVAEVNVNVAFASLHSSASNWLIEPKAVNGQLLVARSLLDDSQSAAVRIVNPLQSPVLLPAGQYIATAEAVNFHCQSCGSVCSCIPVGVSDQDVAGQQPGSIVSGIIRTIKSAAPQSAGAVADNDNPAAPVYQPNRLVPTDAEIIQPMLDSLPAGITDIQRTEVRELLRKNVDLFAKHDLDCGAGLASFTHAWF